ncbi:MAG: DUF4374 domain-containing protein, partial [Bacteroidota bacterium]
KTMKKNTLIFCKSLFGIGIVFSATLLLFSCGDDDNEVMPTNLDDLVMATSTQADIAGNRSYFLQKVSLDVTGTVDNSNATELTASGAAIIQQYGNSMYFVEFSNNPKIIKYDFNENGEAVEDGEISVLDIVFPGNAWFLDDNTAFVGGFTGEIIIFNPTTMQRTGKINFQSLLRIGEVTNFPMEGNAIVSEAVSEIVVRDNIMFAAIIPYQDLSTFTPGDANCHLLVVDLNQVDVNSDSNSDAVVKRIVDTRGAGTGSAAFGGSFMMRVDENNDLYVLSHNMYGNPAFREALGKPTAVLKIANGSTEFDENYYFNLETAADGLGMPVVNFEYYGGGKFMASVQDPSQFNATDPFSYFNDAVYRWYSFDLASETAQRVSEDYTVGIIALSYFKDGIGYMPVQNNTASYIMEVDLNSLETNELFNTSGAAQLFELAE